MRISVVIPVYNEEKYIENCLTALSQQELKPDEIIVVDNNCTDNTISLVEKFDVKIIKEKKQGMTYARNKGFDVASGDIIARCDADTIPHPDWIKKIQHDFSNLKIDALGGPLDIYDLPFSNISFKISIVYANLIRLTQKGNGMLIGPNMALTKKIWETIKNDVCMENEEVHEDVDLTIHITRAGGKILFDENLTMPASGRRIKGNPLSFFLEYPLRLINTLRLHPK